MKKLSRREAALVREAKRKAITEYEEKTWILVNLNSRRAVEMTLATCRAFTEINGWQGNDLVIDLTPPI